MGREVPNLSWGATISAAEPGEFGSTQIVALKALRLMIEKPLAIGVRGSSLHVQRRHSSTSR